MKRLLTLLVPVLLIALVVACGDDEDDNGDALRIGALLPTSGALQSYGVNSEAALNAAVDAINEGDGPSVQLVVENTNSDPETALERLQALHEDGIRVVIGPYSSSEVAAVLDFASQNGILLLSPLSTAHSLAIPGDILYRYTPDDIEEGVAVANLAWADGVRTMVTVNRDDVGNAGLGVAVADAFEAIGGTVIERFVYGPDVTEFFDLVDGIEMTVADSGAPAGEVGIYLAAFAEVRDLLEEASNTDTLGDFLWYGSNSVALSSELLENETAAQFSIATGYPNPILGLRDEDESLWGPVMERLNAELGRDPDAFALAAYDALIVGHAALVEAGEDADVGSLQSALVSISDSTVGLTGPLTLNEAGDRALASYDFWGVCEQASGDFTWVRIATYVGGGDAQRLEPSC